MVVVFQIHNYLYEISVLKWFNSDGPIDHEKLQNLFIETVDFERALKIVSPSSKREGFATVPDVSWDDIGALKDVRTELEWSILVSFIRSI